jgi:transposase-like protein
MAKGIRKSERLPEDRPAALGELIHAQVRVAIETAVHEELAIALGAGRYERHGERRGYRNGIKARTLTGPTGPLALTLPRATLEATGREWRSTIVPRYQRRMREVNEAVIATYLAGGNQRRIRAALHPLLKAAPLSKSAVSRIVATLKDGLTAWTARPLAEVELVYLYLDAVCMRVRSAGKVASVPVLTAVAVLADGRKELLALELCGSESGDAWRDFVADLQARGLRPPLLAVIDGNPGLRQALSRTWPATAVQRCAVHKLRNLERKAPKHALDELREDFHRIVYAASADAGRAAYGAFERKWAKRCPGVVRSLQEGGAELLTFFTFPKAQWKTLRTTNVIERLNEEFRRRVKTQGSLPTEDAALILLFSLVASGQIKLRKIDGHATMATVISKRLRAAASRHRAVLPCPAPRVKTNAIAQSPQERRS